MTPRADSKLPGWESFARAATVFVSRVDVQQAKRGDIDPHARMFEIGVPASSR